MIHRDTEKRGLEKHGSNTEMAKLFIEKNIPLGDKINPHTLEEFREFEEQVFDQKQGEA